MNAIKKYWNSVYIYLLLLVPCTCMMAGLFWTICKIQGLYPLLSWYSIAAFDISQLIYLLIALYFIFQNRKDTSYISKHLRLVKIYIVCTTLVQYLFILYLFPSTHVWGCTFIFFAVIVFPFDSRVTGFSLIGYLSALLTAHILKPEKFLPLEAENLLEIIAFRIVILGLTAFCVYLIVYFVERFLIQAQEQDEENVHLLHKQLEHYKNVEFMDRELRKFRHDIRTHFICMEAFLKDGQEEKLHDYFKELQQAFSFQEKLFFSGNEVVDAILNWDLQQYCSEKVKIKVYGNLTNNETISDMDLCTLFSNLLSNAITAANQCCEHSEAEIMIHFSSGKQYFSIEIANSAKTDWSLKEQMAKHPEKSHGFGIHKIVEIIEKYNGNIEQSSKQGMITITTYLPI